MTAHSQRQHARLAPSSAHIWINCPGSVQMSEGLDDEETVYQAEGTAAHELAHMCALRGQDHTGNAEAWRGWRVNSETGSLQQFPGRPTMPWFEVTAEMADAVQLYLDVVREIPGEKDFEVRLETQVEGSFGTGDCVIYNEAESKLTIVDFKYGRGVAVEVQGNEQLMLYASGAVKRHHNRPVGEIELMIVQPRAFHRDGPVRRWTLTPAKLWVFVSEANASRDDPAALVAGPHCKFCPAAGFCPALRDKVLDAVGAHVLDGEIFTMADPKNTADDIARHLRNAAIVSNWVRSVEKFAHLQAVKGNMPTGYKFVATRSHRKWKDEGYAADVLGMLGVEALYTEPELRSPAQLEKELPRKDRAAIMPALTMRELSSFILAPESDPRHGVDIEADVGFENLEE